MTWGFQIAPQVDIQPRNVTIAITITTFTALTTAIFTVATLSRLRYIKSASVRVVEKRLLTITEILAMSLMGQFTIEVGFKNNNLIKKDESRIGYYNVFCDNYNIFLIKPQFFSKT